MKKFFLLLFCSLCSLAAYSQTYVPPYAVYEPSRSQEELQDISSRASVVGALCFKNYGSLINPQTADYSMKRVSVKVSTYSNDMYYGTKVCVIGVKDFRNSYNPGWRKCFITAERVDPRFDGAELADAFEWKVTDDTLGPIYFNY